jgi:two-component system, NarL family, sensor histidine kinase DesK
MDMRAERAGKMARLRAAVSNRVLPRAWSDARDRAAPPAFWLRTAFFCLLFLYYPLHDLLRSHPAPGRLFVALAGMVIFVGIYLRLVLYEPFGAGSLSAAETRRHLLLLAVIVAIVLFLTLAYNVDWMWFVLYANLVAGLKLPTRLAAATIAAFTLVTLGVTAATLGWHSINPAVSTVLSFSILMVGVSRILATIRELRAARQEIARLAAAEAVVEERLRFARDLHDLLGRSLSSITLKNELARRLVRGEPDRAEHELDDTIAMARDALREMRETVAGYRQMTLGSEVRSAREILGAAGIACRCEEVSGALPPAVESVLAWAVREGVTNVVRHSRARHCTIRVACAGGIASAEVSDDGCGAATSPARTGDSVGNGLRGLAERAAQQHGHLEAGPCATGGFRLRVMVPVGEDARTAPEIGAQRNGRG